MFGGTKAPQEIRRLRLVLYTKFSKTFIYCSIRELTALIIEQIVQCSNYRVNCTAFATLAHKVVLIME